MLSSTDIARLHSSTISDVLDAKGVHGVLPTAVRRLNSPATGPMFGRAVTVRWRATRKQSSIHMAQPDTWSAVRDFLLPKIGDGRGLVYVGGSDNGLCLDYALAGGMSCTDFARRGFSGVVLGGAVRDRELVDRIKLPVFASNYSPADTQGNYFVAETGTECMVGTVRVATGDFIFGDGDGVVCVPSSISDEVIASAAEIEDVEIDMVRRIESGQSLHEIVLETKRI